MKRNLALVLIRKILRKEVEEGFSLIELVVLVAVLSLLALITIPSFNCFPKKAKAAAALAALRQINTECQQNRMRASSEDFTSSSLDGYTIQSSGFNSCNGANGVISAVPANTNELPTFNLTSATGLLTYAFRGETGTNFTECLGLICSNSNSSGSNSSFAMKKKKGPLTFSGNEVASVETPTSVELGDMDGDGDLDFVVIGFSGGTTWFENDGSGNFIEHKIPNAPSGYGASLADMDGDGDMDIVTSGNGLSWLRNDGRSNPSYTKVDIPTAWTHNWGSGREVFLKDMDGDGDNDIVGTKNGASRNDDGSVTSHSQVTWYENDGGSNPSFNATIISTDVAGAQDVHVEDMDGDGDFDVVVATQDDDSVAWFENTGGSNKSWKNNQITNQVDATNGIFVGDMDGDGDMDILSASQDDSRIAWYENNGNKNPSFEQIDIAKDECCGRGPRDPSSGQNLPIAVGQAMDVRAADMDGDGDLDVIATNYEGYYHVYDNEGGSNPSFKQNVFAQRKKEGVYMVQPYEMDHGDIDGDGDIDVISISRYENKVFWYGND